ncbi:MAG: sigma-54-dependent Fis family transcriptional regulator [Betaproteobacteria bacterium]|uniref:Sigma-54-dependent Fis family transcriptional regulator n=1 Tax=Candidatus Proximibacter danicus TaxID=2954365 RepID=A0A9D7PSQ4_9PROT|nr:sigma-54-dependent Fis family transcriptional regulator [Candidatus Proximibacter danicus]MBK9446075.1 sigma-54-dependent Fis family transcriptional regulator [Betaproteobacteria bacterium]
MEPLPNTKQLLLIVDDDPLIADTLSIALRDAFEIITSHSRPQAIQLLRQLRQPPALALVDLGLPPLPHRPDEGFALISELIALIPGMRIVVLSGQNDDANARHARTLGAADFVGKPCHPADLRKVLERVSLFGFDTPAPADDGRPSLIGNSLAMQKLRAQLAQYAESPFPVLVEGESGSGKEIIARCLHYATSRRQQPFLALNCAAISPTLVEPTLFGHAKGAFTGASGAKAGYFEDAGEGTLFLDEIGELPLELQAKLLRVLENGEYQRVGETQTRTSRARILTATNRDLRHEIRQGRFRADLYHRLSVFTIDVPPLREMGEDRLRLLDHYRQYYAQGLHQKPFELEAAARSLWLGYAFPGNVRELRNIIIRLTAKYPGALVSSAELAQELDLPDEPLATAANSLPTPPSRREAALHRLQQAEPFNLDTALAEMEQTFIDAALAMTDGNVSQAARLLGINRTTLYSRMESSPAIRSTNANSREP